MGKSNSLVYIQYSEKMVRSRNMQRGYWQFCILWVLFLPSITS